MSEVKGTLLTVILALLVFTAVSASIVGAIRTKASTVGSQISQIDSGYTPAAQGTTPEAGAAGAM